MRKNKNNHVEEHPYTAMYRVSAGDMVCSDVGNLTKLKLQARCLWLHAYHPQQSYNLCDDCLKISSISTPLAAAVSISNSSSTIACCLVRLRSLKGAKQILLWTKMARTKTPRYKSQICADKCRLNVHESNTPVIAAKHCAIIIVLQVCKGNVQST